MPLWASNKRSGKLIGDVKNGVLKGRLIGFERKCRGSLHDGSIRDKPLRIGAWIANKYVVTIYHNRAIVFRLVGAVSLKCNKFVVAFSKNNDPS